MDVKFSKVEAENAGIAIDTLSISNEEIWTFYS